MLNFLRADPVRSMDQVRAMKPLDDPLSSLPFISETLSSLRKEIDDETTLLGFVGTPWTLAAYAMEGKAERHCMNTKVCHCRQPTSLVILGCALDYTACAQSTEEPPVAMHPDAQSNSMHDDSAALPPNCCRLLITLHSCRKS